VGEYESLLHAVMSLQAITEAYDFLTNPSGEPPTTGHWGQCVCAHLHCHARLCTATMSLPPAHTLAHCFNSDCAVHLVCGELTTLLLCCAAPAERMRSSYGASSSAARGGSSSSRAYHYNVNTDWSHYETGSTGYTSTISKFDWNLLHQVAFCTAVRRQHPLVMFGPAQGRAAGVRCLGAVRTSCRQCKFKHGVD
jgi:hypothetical protein